MVDPCFEQWSHHRWVNTQSQRYYEARLLKNLMEEWEVFCVWGGLGSRLGGSAVIPALSLTDAEEKLACLHKLRIKRHYVKVLP